MAREPLQLKNARVMVTRPAHLAGPLAGMLEERGAAVIRFPCMEIVDVSDTPENRTLMQRLHDFRLLVFISRNAVAHGFGLMRRMKVTPPRTAVAAVGIKTAEALQNEGVNSVVHPEHAMSSEALAATVPVKNIRSGEVLIFRGEGGSEKLAEALRAQGAGVCYAEVYRRRKPAGAKLSFADKQPAPDLVLAASGESLSNLWELTEPGSRPQLRKVTVVLGSAAMVATHRALGFSVAPVIARSPMNEDMLQAVLDWRSRSGAQIVSPLPPGAERG